MINIRIAPNGALVLTAGNETRSTLAQWLREGERTRAAIYADLFESYACNGSYAPCEPQGLTDSPCIAESLSYDDDGAAQTEGRLWWFPDYMVCDELAQLARYGVTRFTLAQSE